MQHNCLDSKLQSLFLHPCLQHTSQSSADFAGGRWAHSVLRCADNTLYNTLYHFRGTFYSPLFSLYKYHILISVINQSIVTYYLLCVKYNSFEVIWMTQNDDMIKLTRSLSFI